MCSQFALKHLYVVHNYIKEKLKLHVPYNCYPFWVLGMETWHGMGSDMSIFGMHADCCQGLAWIRHIMATILDKDNVRLISYEYACWESHKPF